VLWNRSKSVSKKDGGMVFVTIPPEPLRRCSASFTDGECFNLLNQFTEWNLIQIALMKGRKNEREQQNKSISR
jgi:hypothetical protein